MIKDKLFANFAHPRGGLGRLAGRIMAAKGDNNARARWAVAELDPKPDARVLEVGYGPGVAIALMAERLPDGTVVGVDSSDVMRAQASRRNRSAVAAGLVENFPEVSASTRINKGGYPVFRYNDKAFSEERVYWADSTVFNIFTMPFLAGEPEQTMFALALR